MTIHKRNYLNAKTFVLSLAALLSFTLSFSQGMAQESAGNEQDEKVMYVKMEIENNGLHCPFLGVSLKDKIKTNKDFHDCYIDKDDRFLTFNYLAEKGFSKEDIEKIPRDVGYPEEIINVTISENPIDIE